MEKFSHAYGICGPKMKRTGYIMKELFKEVHKSAAAAAEWKLGVKTNKRPDGTLN